MHMDVVGIYLLLTWDRCLSRGKFSNFNFYINLIFTNISKILKILQPKTDLT